MVEGGGDDQGSKGPAAVGGNYGGENVEIRLRISRGEVNIKMQVKTKEPFSSIQFKLITGEFSLVSDDESVEIEDLAKTLEESRLRLYFGGKMMTDSMTVASAGIAEGAYVQIIVTDKS